MQTTVQQLEAQLNTQTLFPLPTGLASKDGAVDSFFYMKPARYRPSKTPTSTITANLVYAMDTLAERHAYDFFNTSTAQTQHGIGFIANMRDWSMREFAVDYCQAFMQALQGIYTPVQAALFLIVDPPAWFGRVWSIMKPMLGVGFTRKVFIIAHEELDHFLQPGFEQYLPDEFGGDCDTATLVHDFIAYRLAVEEEEEDQQCQTTTSLRDASLPAWPTRRSERRHKSSSRENDHAPRKRQFRTHARCDNDPLAAANRHHSIPTNGCAAPPTRSFSNISIDGSQALSVDSAPVLPRRSQQ